MKQEWMLDLLTDIRECALKTGMFSLAEQLEDSIIIAASEIRETCEIGMVDASTQHEEDRSNIGRVTDRDHS